MAGAGDIRESEVVYISLPKVSLLIAVLFSATVSVLVLVSQYYMSRNYFTYLLLRLGVFDEVCVQQIAMEI